MSRVPRLTARFVQRQRALGVSGVAAIALRKTVGALARDVLPGPLDFETLMPPVQRVWVRRVPGQNLWVFYLFDVEHVSLVSLATRPPIPLD